MTTTTGPPTRRGAAYLASRPGVDGKRLAAAGGSCGVNQAVQFARRHAEVKTLVLLAGGTDTAGQEHLARASWIPIFGVAADDDGDAVGLMRWIVGFSSNPANRLKTYAKGGHGTALFPVHADLEPAIVSWFETHLVTHAAPAPAAGAKGKPGPSARVAAELRGRGGASRMLQRLRGPQGLQSAPLAPEAHQPPGLEHLPAGRVPTRPGLRAHAGVSESATLRILADARGGNDTAKAAEYARKALDAWSRQEREREQRI